MSDPIEFDSPDGAVDPAAICPTVHLSCDGNPHPSEHFISRVARRLEAERTIPRDANLVERIKMMTTAEIVELATTGEISMWSNRRVHPPR